MDSTLLEIFSTRLRETRGDMMQATFAQKIGVSRASLSSYENGTRIPDIETLKRIHEETNVSVYYLLGLSDSKDDTLAIVQRDTGLSEKALHVMSSDNNMADLVDQFVSHDDFPQLARMYMVIHDNELVLKNEPKLLTPAGKQNTIKLKADAAALTEKILHDDPTPFYIEREELPIIAANREIIFLHGLRAMMERYQALYPNPSDKEKEIRARAIYEYIHQNDKPPLTWPITDTMLSPEVINPHGEETPE